jgi:hypothetical protein
MEGARGVGPATIDGRERGGPPLTPPFQGGETEKENSANGG